MDSNDVDYLIDHQLKLEVYKLKLLSKNTLAHTHLYSLSCTHTHTHTHTHTQFYSDRAVQRDVMNVLVKCENHTTGCPWTGQLKN